MRRVTEIQDLLVRFDYATSTLDERKLDERMRAAATCTTDLSKKEKKKKKIYIHISVYMCISIYKPSLTCTGPFIMYLDKYGH